MLKYTEPVPYQHDSHIVHYMLIAMAILIIVLGTAIYFG